MGKAATLGLLLALAVAAQRPARKPAAPPPKPAPQPDRWPLARISIVGNRAFPADAIVRASGLRIGQPVNRADLEKALQRLTETGVFDTLSFRYEPVNQQLAVTFEVQEVIDLFPVAFDRIEVPGPELVRYLTERVPLFSTKVPATGAMVKRLTAALEERLKYPVVGRLQPGPGGAMRMTFLPAAQPPSITYVRFEGAQSIRDVDLQKEFYQTAVGVPYTEPRLAELLDHNIRPLFEEKGRLRVRFGPFAVKETSEPAGVEVTVPVQEGELFRFGEFQFAGYARMTRKDLSRLVRFKPEEVANFALVRETITEVERLYRRNGFLRVNAAAERTIHDDQKTVDLVIRIQEGDQYRFRSLQITGLDIVAEAAVRRRWAIQKGQPYDDFYPEVFLQRIAEEQMFDHLGKTAPRRTIDDEAKMVDVELVFTADASGKPGEGARRRRP